MQVTDAPILLFLERISTLTLDLIDRDGETSTSLLRRYDRPLDINTSKGERRTGIVDLREQGRYLLTSARFEPKDLMDALRQSVRADHLDAAWQDWGKETRISVAVRLDAGVALALMYTYLPMAISSPFKGHLNAPFYTKLCRVAVSDEAPLNSFLLDRVADLCAATIFSLVAAALDVSPTAVVDLLCWSEQFLAGLERAFERQGQDLDQAPVLPVVTTSGSGRWSSLWRTLPLRGNSQVSRLDELNTEPPVLLVGVDLPGYR